MAARRKPAAGELNDLEQRFVQEYLTDLSQCGAMERAYGDGKKRAYRTLGYQMMHRAQVRAAVDAGLDKQNKRLQTTADDVKLEIIRMAMFDPAHVTAVTCPADIALLPPDVRRAIVGWSWDRNGNFTVKMAKEDSLEKLAKHYGLYAADNHQKGTLTVKKTAADMTDDELLAIAQQRKNEPKPAASS